MYIRNILLFSTLMILGGCATHQPGISAYNLVEEQDFKNIPPEPTSKDHAILIIKRDSGLEASALAAKIYLNGLFLLNVRAGRYVRLKVDPGEHLLLVKTSGELFLPFKHQLKVNLEANTQTYIRLYPKYPTGIQIAKSPN